MSALDLFIAKAKQGGKKLVLPEVPGFGFIGFKDEQ